MGLASSQARLLTITARLTDNEYRSQQIANQRIKLSDISCAARTEYNDALNSNTFVYINYNNVAGYAQTNLSPAVLFEYQPNKNQYALANTSGKVLVSETDAANFRQTDNLAEFLKRYDCLENQLSEEIHKKIIPGTKENPEYIAIKEAQEEYDRTHPEPDKQILVGGTDAWTERVHNSPIYDAVLNASSCMKYALRNTNCYMHVFADLLGVGTYTTSYKDEEGNPYTYSITGDCEEEDHNAPGGWCWHVHHHGHEDISEELRQQLKEQKVPAHEYHEESVDIKYEGEIYKDINTISDDFCNTEMTLYQKIIDLLWKAHDDYQLGSATGGSANPEHLAEFFHFIEFDLDEAEIIEHPATDRELVENPDWQEWNENRPNLEGIPEIIDDSKEETYNVINEKLTIVDPEKAQWYTNLWYRMNGFNNPEKIEKLTPETINEKTEEIKDTEYILSLMNIEKITHTENFEILNEHLMGSKDWLNNALSQGWVTLEKVGKTQSSNKFEYTWSSIIYSNATDITQTEDEEKIALAESKYTKTIRDVEAKDKKLQADMTKLDTEHNALQTKYQSIKSALDKNVERSFKIFQG